MSEIDHSPCREEVLRAEIERLRAALQHIAEATSDKQWTRPFAQQAMEGRME